jgi:hypothetical protein
MRATKFVVDAIAGHVLNGLTRGETWDGWARLFFTYDYDEAQKIVAAHKEHGLNAYYDLHVEANNLRITSHDFSR